MLLKVSLEKIQEDIQNDYDQILEFYPTLSGKNAQSISPEMDIIIEKTNKVIDKHPKSKWVDDCYLLMARAYLLKSDFTNAIESIHFITSEYHANKQLLKKKRKKKKRSKRKKSTYKKGQVEEKPMVEVLLEKYKITHQPVYYEAIILLIQIYIEQTNFYKAEAVFEFVRNDTNFPEFIKDDIKLIQAYLYIKKTEYDKATKPLQEAILLTKRKKTNSKYTYILAQLYKESGNNKRAIKEFNNVLKLNPEYELAFNAKLSIAKTFEKRAGISIREVRKQLESLAKDEKNIDYLDEIYYTIGMISLEQGREKEALINFNKSITANTINAKQKGKSYLKIGEMYFEESNYKIAHMYYDSAVTYLPKDMKSYPIIEERSLILKKLYAQTNTIYVEDSLQELALLPELELDEFIDNLIDEKINQLEEEKAQQEFLEASNANTNKNSGLVFGSTNKKKVNFYFYNEDIRTKGMQNFISTWGNRKLEDNWRRSDKSSGVDIQVDEEDEEYLIAEDAILDREQYYKNIPLTPEQLEKSNEKMIIAYVKAAVIYKDDLKNSNEAIDLLIELIERYPDSDQLLEAYYYLVLLYNDNNQQGKAKIYKDLILQKHPTSEIATFLRGTKKESKKEIDDSDYLNIYNLYLSRSYSEVIESSNLYLNSEKQAFRAKIMLLKGLSYGQTKDYKTMIPILEEILSLYPKSDEGLRSEGILNALSNKKKVQQSDNDPEGIYVYRPKETHYYCVAIDNELSKTNNLSVEVSNFNQKVHRLEDFKISTLSLGDGYSIVTVKSFSGEDKALSYFETIKNEKTLFKTIPPSKLNSFLISENNFKKLMSLGELKEYMEFFNKYYKN